MQGFVAKLFKAIVAGTFHFIESTSAEAEQVNMSSLEELAKHIDRIANRMRSQQNFNETEISFLSQLIT